MINQVKGQSFRKGNIKVRVVLVKNVLRPDISMDKFLLKVIGGLPGFSEVDVHFVEYFHVLLLEHFLELCMIGILFFILFQLILPGFFHHLLGL